ncbi:MAG: glucose-6-phosphate isomerase [Gammaproteobacteria bacterium]|nr:glucose-6-phosphate isomerase [Gammaproteobacteria bacterium]
MVIRKAMVKKISQMTADNLLKSPRQTPAWALLEKHAADLQGTSLQTLLDTPDRYSSCSLQLNELCLDYSRQLVTSETLNLLSELAEQTALAEHIELMFSGAHVNLSEDRAALHTALRAAASSNITLNNEDIYPLVETERERFLSFADAVRDGQLKGYGDTRIRQVINIGIGGSDLGPRMLSRALAVADGPVQVDFAAGLDGIELQELLHKADPAATLFIVCSKTFTTLETRTNADMARAWLLQRLPEDAVASNFAAVSVNHSALDDFGIAPDARFCIWDWVGGRYSVWSAIGLAVAMTTGSKVFRELLDGAAQMDEHFRVTSFSSNLPVITALLGIWNQNFLGLGQNVVLPYDQRLEYLPDYLQQLVMESEGKGVRRDGMTLDHTTGGALWGGPGSNAQHSFAQWLQQGNASAYITYIATANGSDAALSGAHLLSLANMIAQAETLARGQDEADVRAGLAADGLTSEQIKYLAPQKVHPGNRPSSIILLRSLSPANLGMLLALYEHQVYVQSVIWGINPFDQWGVELGKLQAKTYASALTDKAKDVLPGIGEQLLNWSDT